MKSQRNFYDLPLFLFFGLIVFFLHNYSSLPHHQPTDSLALHNHFFPFNSSDFSLSFILMPMYFFTIPSHSITLSFVPESSKSLVYKPSTYFLSSETRSPLYSFVLGYTNLVLLSFLSYQGTKVSILPYQLRYVLHQ